MKIPTKHCAPLKIQTKRERERQKEIPKVKKKDRIRIRDQIYEVLCKILDAVLARIRKKRREMLRR